MATICLRPAQADDCVLFYSVRVDPQVRRNAFDDRRWVSDRQYRRWFARSLRMKNRRLFVVEAWLEVGVPTILTAVTAIGVVRLDLDSRTVEISYALRAAQRGQGFGREVVRLASEQATALWPDRDQIAHIRANNTPSLRAALKAGFSLSDGRCLTLRKKAA